MHGLFTPKSHFDNLEMLRDACAMVVPFTLEKSIGSRKSTQVLGALGKSEKALALIMLLCSRTHKISASMHKASKVTTSSSDSPCTPMTCSDALMQRLQDAKEQ